jgi:hypothetical protein
MMGHTQVEHKGGTCRGHTQAELTGCKYMGTLRLNSQGANTGAHAGGTFRLNTRGAHAGGTLRLNSQGANIGAHIGYTYRVNIQCEQVLSKMNSKTILRGYEVVVKIENLLHGKIDRNFPNKRKIKQNIYFCECNLSRQLIIINAKLSEKLFFYILKGEIVVKNKENCFEVN